MTYNTCLAFVFCLVMPLHACLCFDLLSLQTGDAGQLLGFSHNGFCVRLDIDTYWLAQMDWRTMEMVLSTANNMEVQSKCLQHFKCECWKCVGNHRYISSRSKSVTETHPCGTESNCSVSFTVYSASLHCRLLSVVINSRLSFSYSGHQLLHFHAFNPALSQMQNSVSVLKKINYTALWEMERLESQHWKQIQDHMTQ